MYENALFFFKETTDSAETDLVTDSTVTDGEEVDALEEVTK